MIPCTLTQQPKIQLPEPQPPVGLEVARSVLSSSSRESQGKLRPRHQYYFPTAGEHTLPRKEAKIDRFVVIRLNLGSHTVHSIWDYLCASTQFPQLEGCCPISSERLKMQIEIITQL